MKIGLCPSVNGFGHIRRLSAIAKGLSELGYDVEIILPNFVQDIQIDLIKEISLKFKVVNLNKEFGNDSIIEGPFVDLNFRNRSYSYTAINKLHDYDCLISDTITWPARYNPNTILLAQFTWQQYYARNNSIKYKKNDFDFIKFKAIYGMELFSWNEIKSIPNFIGIKPLDYWDLRKKTNIKFQELIGIANNGVLPNFGQNLNIPYPIVEVKGIPEFLNNYSYIPRIMVMRAGLGNVLEALATGCKIVTIASDEALDVIYNETILTRLDLSCPLETLSMKKWEKLMSDSPTYKLPLEMLSIKDFCSILDFTILGL